MRRYYLVLLLYFSVCQNEIAQPSDEKVKYLRPSTSSPLANVRQPSKNSSRSVSSVEDTPWLTLLPSFQEQQSRFSWLTPNDRLSQSHVEAMLKDHLGFMWFATEEGLTNMTGIALQSINTTQNIKQFSLKAG